jgi:hypothetical protein
MEQMRRARARARLALACAAVAAAACEPLGPIPGGRLQGEAVREAVSDWSFANPHETIQIETRVEDPHSVTVWCVAHEGRLYIPSRHPEKKRWVQNVQEDPRVRVRVAGKIYVGRASRVTDPAEIEAVVPALLRKYDLDPPQDEEPDVWIFRIDAPVGPGSSS